MATVEAGGAAPSVRTLDMGTRLAIERTQLGAERTLMAWIRTAFSMISFGFTIGKFIEYLEKSDQAGADLVRHGWLPRLLVLIGLASLVVGQIEYRRTMLRLGKELGIAYRTSPVGVISVLVALAGILAFVGMFIRIKFL
jgi:putative membrane protein